MAERRIKKRTQFGAANGTAAKPGNNPSKPGDRSPKSMVIRIGAGEVGPSVSQLVKDVRKVMEPATASRLKERRNNKLRDYTTMAGPLGVTHLLLFSRSENGNTNLRLAVTPRGPTLHFRVESYSLSKDVYKSQRRPRSGGSEYLAAPLLVMNNFTTKPQDPSSDGQPPQQPPQIPKHLETLTTTIFQSLFPPINPTTTSLKNIKRILLLDRQSQPSSSSSLENSNNPSYVLNLRHYAIETRTAKSVAKPLRRLDAARKVHHQAPGQKRKREGLPNLGKLDDVADFMLDPHAADGFTSGSDSEPETDAEIEVVAPVAQRIQKKNTKQDQKKKHTADGEEDEDEDGKPTVLKKGVKLHELGPRLRLRLTKVEEGLCDGKIMWHEYIHKSERELKEMDRVHEQRRQEKERRKAEQKANVERKRAERRANGEEAGDDEDEDVDMDDDDDVWEDQDVEDEMAVDQDEDEEDDDDDEEDG